MSMLELREYVIVIFNLSLAKEELRKLQEEDPLIQDLGQTG